MEAPPAREEMRALLREGFEEWLDLLLPLARARGSSYDGLVRAAYPRRRDIQRRMEGQVEVVRRQLGLLERHPGLLRVPGPVRGEMFRVFRRMLDFGEARTQQRLERIYGSREG